jgi:DNA-binding NarL/FixJ family response regulator
MAKGVTTILVARNSLFREGLLRILSSTAFRVTKVVSTIHDLSLHSIRTARPVLFLLGRNGAHAVTAITVGRLKEQNPTARIVVLSDRCGKKILRDIRGPFPEGGNRDSLHGEGGAPTRAKKR